jgi:hypothetical protein
MAGVDEGLVGLVEPGVAQLMPHGGPRVMQKLEGWLRGQGVEPKREEPINPRQLYPEAASGIEADVLHAMAGAASPAAVDVLAAQPGLWRGWREDGGVGAVDEAGAWGYLLEPATVVVVGRPNAGKSTLINQLTGRASSVVADRPGTTRDWVSQRVELVPAGGDVGRDAVAVRWLDTPGLRESGDVVEQRAIGLAERVVAAADVLVVLRRSGGDWPERSRLPRRPDLWVVNRFGDEAVGAFPEGTEPAVCVEIDASRADGVGGLTAAVLERLGWARGDAVAQPWVFSPWLARWSAGGRDLEALRDYLGVAGGV